MISYDEAIRIAQTFSKEVTGRFPGKIVAVYAIGSLGSDYYRPGQSDIDTAVITNCGRQDLSEIAREIGIIKNRYWKDYQVPKGFGAIVFAEEQLYPPYVAEEELILEILRLKTQSKLLYGKYNVDDIPMPGKQAIIDDVKSFQAWADHEKKVDSSFDVFDAPKLVNSTLIALKRYLMIQHGIVEFNKFKVIDLYLRNNPPLVDEETFAFIDFALHHTGVEVDAEKLARMVQWHERLFTTINHLVLN